MLTPKRNKPSVDARCIKTTEDYIHPFYRTFRCRETYVGEALKDELPQWHFRNPVLIEAPPGRGKTTFIYEDIIPKALKDGKNVLILSNRIALSIQQKLAIMEVLNSPLAQRLNDEGIRTQEDFGSVHVITYHRLPTFLKDPASAEWIKNLGYVIADEAHFFASDSFFHERCGYLLKLMTQNFQHAVRIYLTATSWDVLRPLAEAEKRDFRDFKAITRGWEPPRTFYRYMFPADYSHIDLSFFKNLSEIKDEILKNPEEKFVVFVDNKKDGKAFAATLGDRAQYIDADNKKSEKYLALLKESRFEAQVLVATKIIDCGINIHDDQVRNMVIVTDDHTDLVQMLGRRRRCKPDEQIKLYVCDLSMQKIGARFEKMKKMQDYYERYEKADAKEHRRMADEMWRSPDDQLRLYFHLAGFCLIPNYMAFYTLERKMRFYEDLLAGKFTFQSAVRNWLGIPAAEKVDHLEALIAYCSSHKGIELSESEVDTFRNLILQACEQQGMKEAQPSRSSQLKQEALNNRLHSLQIPYRIRPREWVVEDN